MKDRADTVVSHASFSIQVESLGMLQASIFIYPMWAFTQCFLGDRQLGVLQVTLNASDIRMSLLITSTKKGLLLQVMAISGAALAVWWVFWASAGIKDAVEEALSPIASAAVSAALWLRDAVLGLFDRVTGALQGPHRFCVPFYIQGSWARYKE